MTKEKRKVIIDCDPGIDDAIALILACASEDLEILGVTITAGNVDRDQCAVNAKKILKLMGREDIPVYLGSDQPLIKTKVIADDTHGENGLGNYILEESETEVKEDAVSFIAETLLKDEDVSIIALGPLTNIAKLIKEHPEAVQNLKELVLMGGAFRTPGNCSPVAEFNFWFDPHAAHTVFEELDRPITMVGLDVTREALLTPNYSALIKNFDQPVSDAIYGMIQFYNDFHWKQEGVLGSVINDPLAVAYFLNPELAEGQDYYVEIIEEGPANGMSMVDEFGITGKKANAKVLTKVDSKAFFNYLLSTIFPDQKDVINKILKESRYGN